jgi:phosphohistidine swiveling domain-containing protein
MAPRGAEVDEESGSPEPAESEQQVRSETETVEGDLHLAPLDEIEAECALAFGRPERIEAACSELAGDLDARTGPGRAADTELSRELGRRFGPLLRRRHGLIAEILFGFLERRVGSAEHVGPLVLALLEAADGPLFLRALGLFLDLVEAGRLTPDPESVTAIGRRVAERRDPAIEAEMAERLASVLRGPPLYPGSSEGTDPLETLLFEGSPRALRYLAADLLDRGGDPAPYERAARGLGSESAKVLAPYLEFTRASHRDLVDLLSPDRKPEELAAMIRRSEQVVGRGLLGNIVAELGWSRLVYRLSVDHRCGLRLADSFPVVLSPIESRLFARRGLARSVWDRYLVTASGGGGDGGIPETAETAIQRLRRYNVRHAEVLGEILEVAPLTVAKTHRILGLMDGIVEDFVTLFASHTEDAERLPGHYAALRGDVVRGLSGAGPEAETAVGPEVTRQVQMFEDPRNLDEARTIHGLKRYLHQQGLRHAFRLFGSGQVANRTVDLLLVSSQGEIEKIRKIRYIDFEAESAGDPAEIPFAVSLAAETYGRCLLHGRTQLPELEILCYGNEVQIYARFRNHPAFLRMDLSPPLRGGMIDLEFFGVSQYEMDNHPNLGLTALQRFFEALEFHFEIDGLHVHARYDKERAFDMADLKEKARLLFCLLPHLMDVDWIIGSLDYPEPARRRVMEAWAEFLIHWGILPADEVLSRDRRRILVERTPLLAGERESVWDGQGAYRDLFAGTPTEDIWSHLRRELEARRLDHVAHWEEGVGRPFGQLTLERCVLAPIREAIASGEIWPSSAGLLSARADTFRREHPVDRFARMLSNGGDRLRRAAELADVVQSVERHLRFRTVGAVQGYPAQVAILPLHGGRVGVFVLRDGSGVTRLALAAEGGVLYSRRCDPREPWKQEEDLEPIELIDRLRRDNYLPPGFTRSGAGGEGEADLRARFAAPNPHPPPHVAPGERTLFGVAAAPGRAVGFAAFGTARLPGDVTDAHVVFARMIRPEDAAIIRRAAAIVSTGGGALSHAGLIAIELEKPALIIDGRWIRQPDGTEAIRYRHREYREEPDRVGSLELVRHADEQEHTETLQEGDLVVIDSGPGTLTVLGHDREALALYQEIRQVESAARDLHHQGERPRVLVERGRLLRSLHRLRRLLERIDRPGLARFAVHELLLGPSRPGGARGANESSAEHRADLLRGLFANPRVGGVARESARLRRADLSRRFEGLAEDTVHTLPRTENAYEVLLLRARFEQDREALAQVRRLLAGSELPPEESTESAMRSLGAGGSAAQAAAPAQVPPGIVEAPGDTAEMSGTPVEATGSTADAAGPTVATSGLAMEACGAAFPIDIDALCRARLDRFDAALGEELRDAADRSRERWWIRHLLASKRTLDRLLPDRTAVSNIAWSRGQQGRRASDGAGERVGERGRDRPGDRLRDRAGDRERERERELVRERPGESADWCAAGGGGKLREDEERRLRDLSGSWILGPDDGGAELAPLVGGKSAHLGEIARILGPGRVPACFTLTAAAVREILDQPAELGPVEPLDAPDTRHRSDGSTGSGSSDPSESAGATLRSAITEILDRKEEIPRKAAAIRRLCAAGRIPPELVEEIRRAYRNLAGDDEPDPLVAIRSSAFEEDTATSAWAGQFDTFLFVRGEEGVLDHIRMALAGLWNERAIRHRQLHGGDPMAAGGGLIIQRMVDARASGVLLTASLVAGGLRQMVINVGPGVGEGVVSGIVDVDQILVSKDTDFETEPLRFQYHVGDKRDRVVFDDRAGFGTRTEPTLYHQRMRPALEYVDLLELARAAAKLERAYRHPIDLEFAFEGDRLCILQVRPIAIFESVLRAAIEKRVFRGPTDRPREAGQRAERADTRPADADVPAENADAGAADADGLAEDTGAGAARPDLAVEDADASAADTGAVAGDTDAGDAKNEADARTGKEGRRR